jgi:hypothetical protein
MRENDFQLYLLSRGMEPQDVQTRIAFIQRLEDRLSKQVPSWSLDDVDGQFAQSIVDEMIDRGENTIENLQTLLLYAFVIKNNGLYLKILQHLDGYEAFNNLHWKLANVVGEDLRDIIFDEMPLPPLGLSANEKSLYAYRIMNRLEEVFEEDTCREVLKDCLRDLPDEMYNDDKKIFNVDCNGDIDCYLIKKGQKFLQTLQFHKDQNKLFFGQEITDEVIAFVKSNKEIGQGIREGDIVYETKIPYNTKAFLSETDPEKKRYHYCHCPWARESIRHGMFKVSATFCQCSAGFHKRPYEIIYGQPLKSEVLQSVLKGDMLCRFAIYLPESSKDT